MMITKEELKRIEEEQNLLLYAAKNILLAGDEKIIRKAISFIVENQSGKRRKDGRLNIFHLIEVARIAVDRIGLGKTSIVAALFHNILRESDVSLSEIEKEFGRGVTDLIKGYEKLSGIHIDKPSLFSENFRNFLFSLSDDIRVILLRLVDRVDLMRNLDAYSRKEQLRYADETFHLYAPLAHRLGLYNLKTELEENAMRYTEPEMYKSIERSLEKNVFEREAYINEFIMPIHNKIREYNYDVEIKGRSKSVYSIWKKMQNQKVKFEQIYDVFAIRIILKNTVVSEKADCWNIYSVITDIFEPNPKRLRDWVTTPKKSTGYESLHTTVKGPGDKWVEVQIRTQRMDEIAETGQAAHWKYKEGKKVESNEERMARIREIMEREDFFHLDKSNATKIDLYRDTIFVFTPTGDLFKLKANSTVLDFAYHIHSNVGDKCTGAIINGKNYSIKYHIKNGDTVKILTSKNQSPSLAWLSIVTSSRTMAKIRRSIRKTEYKDAELGKGILKRKLNQLKIEYSDVLIDKLLKHYKCKLAIDLYQKISDEKIDISDLKKILLEKESHQEEETIVL
ncbi:MAG: HD domain-containing protein, partial [Bacteroidota bacterium]|nr:HD domain-containing protein [Bacteroidota bacterium]